MKRQYEESHPWIDFNFPLDKASPRLWMLLGEAQSKCRHVEHSLLDPDEREEFYALYLAKGVRATTAIEGNTLSEEEVQKALKHELELPKSKEYLGTEVNNIINALNDIGQQLFHKNAPDLCVQEIKDYNKIIFVDLDVENEFIPGEIRTSSVIVGGYRGVPAEDCEYLLERLCEMIHNRIDLGEGWEIASGLLKAIVAHLYIAWIHPFFDGNGRTARLVEFKLCIDSGVPTPAAHLLSNHYNETRTAYYQALDRTSKERNPYIFIEYALQGYVDQLEEQIDKIRYSQYRIFWHNYIHKEFKGMDSPSARRLKHLALDISEVTFDENTWVDINEISMLTPRLAKEYLGKSLRTINRDIGKLEVMGLVWKEKNQVRAWIERLVSFKPLVMPPRD